MEPWAIVLSCIACLIVGGVIGFIICRYLVKKEMEKNPPINEKMIRAMFTSMGRKPSEAQVRQVMNSIKNSK